ncbi:unnamed protein product [Periconia digitata]|uniref:Uncharacterized protein n=1 Tax=Periconia digitata TaxID=1303443 RepID=A0A9W4U2L6_9PLEO|nr:unnamed protein product [Periconia digitata]
MPRPIFFKYTTPFIRGNPRTSIQNLRSWPLRIQPTPPRIQIASLVHVTSIRRSDPNQPFTLVATHRHPNAHQLRGKTYNVDVLLAEEDNIAEVCWRFQIADEEDLLDRLSAYALAFGQHSTENKDYDECVRAFQSKMACILRGRLADQEEWTAVSEDEDGDANLSGFSEQLKGGHGVEEDKSKGNK